MLFLSSKLVGKEVCVYTDDDNSPYDGTVSAVYEGWIEIEADGEICFLNCRHISCIEMESIKTNESVRKRKLFGKKRDMEDI